MDEYPHPLLKARAILGALFVDCAGRAERRRRFGRPGWLIQSGVALRLPPHSKTLLHPATVLIPSSRLMNSLMPPTALSVLIFASAPDAGGAVQHLDSAFEMPAGFHIYRAAGPGLPGRSYALTFDG